jgi:hypothetical protein
MGRRAPAAGTSFPREACRTCDLNATLLHCMGIDHSRFSFKSQGLNQRLTGVEPAQGVKAILA